MCINIQYITVREMLDLRRAINPIITLQADCS